MSEDVKIKICIVPTCDSIIQSDVGQRKYCTKCRQIVNKQLKRESRNRRKLKDIGLQKDECK